MIFGLPQAEDLSPNSLPHTASTPFQLFQPQARRNCTVRMKTSICELQSKQAPQMWPWRTAEIANSISCNPASDRFSVPFSRVASYLCSLCCPPSYHTRPPEDIHRLLCTLPCACLTEAQLLSFHVLHSSAIDIPTYSYPDSIVAGVDSPCNPSAPPSKPMLRPLRPLSVEQSLLFRQSQRLHKGASPSHEPLLAHRCRPNPSELHRRHLGTPPPVH